MALYSVFDPDTYRYNYFQGPGPLPGQRVKPRAKGLAGEMPETLMPVVPAGAMSVGTGTDARGIVAVHGFGQVPAQESGTFVQRHPYLSVFIALGSVMLLYRITVRAVK